MKASAVPLLAIFEKKIRLEVPLFQRQCLGAMVLDQKQAPTTPVEKRQVIDGWQRLT
jgi:hypothetical protein